MHDIARIWAPVLTLLSALATADGGQGAALAFALAGLLLAAAATAAVRVEPRVSAARVRTALRDRTLRTAFLPQRDPDAAGRPRPRAPGAEIATSIR
ncbi:hypothetical protein Acsp04_34860 [Actinomadura sp. NBRC 104425]|uniref:DUF6412 domain-containing protein n=1 Tax=Actinomadura sp. NBRC 104425 TaxID=3032204 RepID=UPI0024A541E8|nr:DUF6412 domain-containing protein [Actinomadura sp. NBRC 104425]GLZ13251.1 hypothetical protein Acsp04_34860 [Actinomadura sp. NBRC 104425]